MLVLVEKATYVGQFSTLKTFQIWSVERSVERKLDLYVSNFRPTPCRAKTQLRLSKRTFANLIADVAWHPIVLATFLPSDVESD